MTQINRLIKHAQYISTKLAIESMQINDGVLLVCLPKNLYLTVSDFSRVAIHRDMGLVWEKYGVLDNITEDAVEFLRSEYFL